MNGEAPYSFNTHYSLNGWPCQLTIRADDYEELSRRVNEAVTQLEAKGATPADMIWAKKPNSNPSTPSAPIREIEPRTLAPRRPVGRPPKRPDTYRDSEGIERCNHLVNGALCTTVGEWKTLPDKKDPTKSWNAWSCAEFFRHDDYIRKQALKEQQPISEVAERTFNNPETPF